MSVVLEMNVEAQQEMNRLRSWLNNAEERERELKELLHKIRLSHNLQWQVQATYMETRQVPCCPCELCQEIVRLIPSEV